MRCLLGIPQFQELYSCTVRDGILLAYYMVKQVLEQMNNDAKVTLMMLMVI